MNEMRVHMPVTTLVPGSLAQTALVRGEKLAMAWLRVLAIILFDRSASMDAADSRGGRTRYQVAIDELVRLQGQMPGRLAIVQFNDTVELVPGGEPGRPAGMTNLAAGLAFVKEHRLDTPGMRLIVISDGEPDCCTAALEAARVIRSRIDVVYVGPESQPDGREFLASLARASGGQLTTADRVSGLAQATVRLLTAA